MPQRGRQRVDQVFGQRLQSQEGQPPAPHLRPHGRTGGRSGDGAHTAQKGPADSAQGRTGEHRAAVVQRHILAGGDQHGADRGQIQPGETLRQQPLRFRARGAQGLAHPFHARELLTDRAPAV